MRFLIDVAILVEIEEWTVLVSRYKWWY